MLIKPQIRCLTSANSFFTCSVARHSFPHCIRPSHISPLEEILNLLTVLWNFPACIFLDLTVPVNVIYSSCSVKPVLMFWLYGLAAAAVTIHQRAYNQQELYWVLTQIVNHKSRGRNAVHEDVVKTVCWSLDGALDWGRKGLWPWRRWHTAGGDHIGGTPVSQEEEHEATTHTGSPKLDNRR